MILSLLLAAATPASPPCAPIDGWDKLLGRKEVRYIVLGEFHGTNEMPAIFADAICLTSKKRSVIVALELPESYQPQIDSWLASNGGPAARSALLDAPFWQGDFKDGRSSEAMFNLLDRLRLFFASGTIRGVVAFQPVNIKNPWGNEEYEKGMAKLITDKTPKGMTALVLVGNIHAMRTEFVRPTMRYVPMAGHLPKRQTLSFDIASDGVSYAWACTGPDTCGPTKFGRDGDANRRSVAVTQQRGDPYDGMVFLGESTTASPPQTTSTKSP